MNPLSSRPPGYTNHTIRQVSVGNPATGTIDEAFEHVDAGSGPNKYYNNGAEVIGVGSCKCFAKLDSTNYGRIAYYYNDTWYYGAGTCLTV